MDLKRKIPFKISPNYVHLPFNLSIEGLFSRCFTRSSIETNDGLMYQKNDQETNLDSSTYFSYHFSFSYAGPTHGQDKKRVSTFLDDQKALDEIFPNVRSQKAARNPWLEKHVFWISVIGLSGSPQAGRKLLTIVFKTYDRIGVSRLRSNQ